MFFSDQRMEQMMKDGSAKTTPTAKVDLGAAIERVRKAKNAVLKSQTGENYCSEPKVRVLVDDVLLIIDAALQTPASDGWMPIETAPMDGRKIDIWVDYPDGGERYENAYFAKDENAFCWDIHETGKRVVFTATPPSHWMPLPAAPLKQSTAKDGEE